MQVVDLTGSMVTRGHFLRPPVGKKRDSGEEYVKKGLAGVHVHEHERIAVVLECCVFCRFSSTCLIGHHGTLG